MESSGTPKCLELNSKAQNTSHWGVLSVIGKVLKRRYRKWPCIGHLDICSPSYGQKKGRKSNWQFDFQPLKVGNRPCPDIRIESATRRWKDLNKGYNFGSDLVAIGLCSRELWLFAVRSYGRPKFRESSWDNFGTPFRESQEFVPFECSLHCELQIILCEGRCWLPPSLGRGESCVSKCPWLVPTPKGVPNAKLTSCGWSLDANSHKLSLFLVQSRGSQHDPLPFFSVGSRERALGPNFSQLDIGEPLSGFTPGFRSASQW